MALEELTDAQQAELTVERIRKQKSFKIAMVGVGVVDKRRAIKELKAGSDTGRALVEIEKRMLKRILAKARSAVNSAGPRQ